MQLFYYLSTYIIGGTTSPSTSGSTSRRQSSGSGAIRKCDNITKYPDKKHIEDKLNQIREYLKITSVLMSRVKEDSVSFYRYYRPFLLFGIQIGIGKYYQRDTHY